MVWEINGVYGMPGSGKTLFMVVVMYWCEQNNLAFLTNVEVTFKNAEIFDNLEEFLEKEKELRLQYVFYDELWREIDARASSSKGNREASQDFFMQIRKYDAKLYHTAQFRNLPDLRLKRLETTLVFPYYDKMSDKLYLLFVNPHTLQQKYKTVHNASFYFKFYDTNQLYTTKPITKKQNI